MPQWWSDSLASRYIFVLTILFLIGFFYLIWTADRTEPLSLVLRASEWECTEHRTTVSLVGKAQRVQTICDRYQRRP